MKDSFFWRCIAVMGIVGLFYLGHNLNSGSPEPLSFTQTAEANTDILVGKYKEKEYFVTTSPDGKTLYFFGEHPLTHYLVDQKFRGKITADK